MDQVGVVHAYAMLWTMMAAREWYVISLRPRGQHGTVRSAASRAGARMVALSPLRIHDRGDEAASSQLRHALAAQACIFTSPNAVRAAANLMPIATRQAIAVGEGTAQALREQGSGAVLAPQRMDSEGLLGLPALRDVAGLRIGLITGEGGRGVIAHELHTRGAEVLRADIYTREVAKISPAAWRAFDAIGTAPAVVLVTSDEALQALLQQLDPLRADTLLQWPAVTPSERLRQACERAGFTSAAVATSPRPDDMLTAAARYVA